MRKLFLKLIKNHFQIDHRFYKIFNKNNLKLNFSCMSNMCSLIKQHNCKVISTRNLNRLCNFRYKDSCPVDGKTCIIYKVEVITNKDGHIYYGASDGEFKSRFNNHRNKTRIFQNKYDNCKKKATSP